MFIVNMNDGSLTPASRTGPEFDDLKRRRGEPHSDRSPGSGWFTARNSSAHTRAHPNGKFVYGGNCGHDSIAIFWIEETTGKMTPAGARLESPKPASVQFVAL